MRGTTGFLAAAQLAVKGAFSRSSKTLYGEDGPHTLVGEGKGGRR
jgi:hypothetical protein